MVVLMALDSRGTFMSRKHDRRSQRRADCALAPPHLNTFRSLVLPLGRMSCMTGFSM